MSALAILKSARNTLTPPRAWTQRSYARDANGLSTHPRGAGASSFCLLGALRHAAEADPVAINTARDVLSHVILRETGHDGAVCFNDHPSTTHDQVIHVLDMAIAIRAQQEKR